MWWMKTENVRAMSGVKHPTEWFCEIITGVDDTRDVGEDNVSSLFPVLDGKQLYVNVPGAFSWVLGIDEFDG